GGAGGSVSAAPAVKWTLDRRASRRNIGSQAASDLPPAVALWRHEPRSRSGPDYTRAGWRRKDQTTDDRAALVTLGGCVSAGSFPASLLDDVVQEAKVAATVEAVALDELAHRIGEIGRERVVVAVIRQGLVGP